MENQPNPAGRQWFRLASIARMEMKQQQQQQQQQQQPQPAQPPRGPPIRRASLALTRAPPLPTTTTPPPPALQTEPTQNQPPPPAAETIPQITKQSPPASPAPIRTLNAQPSPTASSPVMALQSPSPPTQPQVPLAQELQQAAQTAQTANGSYQSPYVNIPKSLDQPSSPSQSTPRLRPILTSRALTPDSPKVIKTSLPTPSQSPRNGWPTVSSPSPNPEPEPKSPPVATPSKTNHFHENSDKNIMKFNSSNGEGVIRNGTESKIVTPKLHPSYNKEERHQSTSNGKDSIAKGSNSKKDEKDMRMITLAGNNLGAAMELGPSFHHHHGRKHQLQDQQSESEKDNKATGKITDAARHSKPMLSLTNSNVQCVNNSILYNASSIQRSPGVYITFNRRRQPKSTNSSAQGGYPTPQ